MPSYFVGIDVGTGSARAGVFDESGEMLGSAKADISLWRETGDIAEQSSNEIWRSVCSCVRSAVAAANIPAKSVAGIGFDATCSLVVVGKNGAPIAIGHSGDEERNVIVWMDHRATDQAKRINATGASVLRYVGGTISPEMETPKLLWLAENLPRAFESAWQFFDLTDFLTWRCTGSLARSTCTVTCKWTYLAHEQRWDDAYFRTIGLGSLADEGFERIGTQIVPGGTALATGLTAAAATELGLQQGTPVGAGMIDAHAGGIGTVGARGGPGTVLNRMAYVFGTSACSMTTTAKPAFVPGVWGPYFSAMVPGLWLNEGGQSAAGAAMDQLVRMHPAAPEASRLAGEQALSLGAWLVERANALGGAAAVERLVGDLHVVPEFLGNRAPFADPDAKALIAGVALDSSLESLVGLYLAGLCGLGYGVRQIIDAQRSAGIVTDMIIISGGAGQSALVRQMLADTTGITVAASTSEEPVLLGSAILGAVASGAHPDIQTAMQRMSSIGSQYLPSDGPRKWHANRFTAFKLLQETGRRIRSTT